MRRFISTVLILSFMIAVSMVTAVSPLQADNGLVENNWWQNIYTMQSDDASSIFSLEHEELSLPGDDFQMFSEEGQEKLYDVASRFGDADEEDLEREDLFQSFQEDSPLQLQESSGTDMDLEGDELNSDDYRLGSRLTLEADEDRELEGDEDDPAPSFNLSYQFSDSTTIRAGLERSYVPSLDIDVEEDGDTADRDESEEDEESPEDDGEEDSEGEEDDDRDEDEIEDETDEDENPGEEEDSTMEPLEPADVDWSEEESEVGTLGISYQPGDSLALTADYAQSNIFENPEDGGTISAALGLEYYDQLGNIRASYQIDEGDQMQQMTTGLQMEVMDFAQFSASYSLLDFEEIEDKLRQQTSLDLGLDLNINEFSTFSLGYQLQENFSELDEDGDDESNIRASFTIDF